MKRKEKPFNPHMIELPDKEYEEQKLKEKQHAKKKRKFESIRHSSWINKGKY